MELAISLLVLACYLAATGLIVMRMKAASRAQPERAAVNLRLLWSAAVALHAAALYQHIVIPDGLDLSFFHSLSLITWLIALFLLIAASMRPVETLGVALLPFAALAATLDQFIAEPELVPATPYFGLTIHIVISLLAYSLLTIAAFQAIMLAVQNQHLHNRHPGGLIRALPPLQFMENLLFQLITIGFILLSLALISGFVFLEDIFAQHLVHKTVLSITAWVVFAVLLWGRQRFGWRGRTAVRWTLGGFGALMLAYLGSKLVLELVLQRYH